MGRDLYAGIKLVVSKDRRREDSLRRLGWIRFDPGPIVEEKVAAAAIHGGEQSARKTGAQRSGSRFDAIGGVGPAEKNPDRFGMVMGIRR